MDDPALAYCLDARVVERPEISPEDSILLLSNEIVAAVKAAAASGMPMHMAIMVANATALRLYETADDAALDAISPESFEMHSDAIANGLPEMFPVLH